MIKKETIDRAYERVRKHLSPTTLEQSHALSNENTKVYLKLENHQPIVKSYKIRGVISKLTSLSEEEKKMGVTAISSGNHGAALAYGANLLKIYPAEIFVPTITPKSKTEKMERYNAKINVIGDNFDETYKIGITKIEALGLIKVDPRDDEVCIAGHGTIGLEIMKELPETDVVLVPIGSGGLITGISSYVKQVNPNIKVIGVQTELNPSMYDSMNEGVWYKTYKVKGDSVCEALIGGVSKFSFDRSSECIDQVLLVNEKEIKDAIIDILMQEKMVCEPSSAIVYAAVKRYEEQFLGKNVVLVMTGSNISPQLLGNLIKEYY